MGAAVTEAMEPPSGGKEEKLGGGEKSVGGERKKEVVTVDSSPGEMRVSKLQTQHPVAPIHVAPHPAATAAAGFQPAPTPPQVVSLASLNSRAYTNRISLLLFVFHLLVAGAAVCFFCYKGVQGLLDFGFPRARRERCTFSLYEIQASLKDADTREGLARIIGTISTKHRRTAQSCASILHLIYKFDYTVPHLAELVATAEKKFGDGCLAISLVREIGRTDSKEYVRDGAGAENIGRFLVELADKSPKLITLLKSK